MQAHLSSKGTESGAGKQEKPTPANSALKIAFFGTPDFSVEILNHLKAAGLMPQLIVTNPDMPKGRGMELAASPVKVWAKAENIPVRQPETLKLSAQEGRAFLEDLKRDRWDVFVVAAYGKIMPREIIDLPLHNTLNVHASLLPKYRGASPIQSAIIADDKEVGVTIMLIDEEMDHGPILGTEQVDIKKIGNGAWPPTASALEKTLALAGGALLTQIIPLWVERKIEAVPQNHSQATYTKKITKSDGEILFSSSDSAEQAYKNFLKIQAFAGWPGAYFFETKHEDQEKRVRVIIKKAEFMNGKLHILRVVREGKKESDYKETN